MSEQVKDSIEIKVVTPKGVSLTDTAYFAKVPGVVGEIGIYPNHSATLAQLKTGEFEIKKDGHIDHFFLSDGMAHITENTLTVLTPYLEKVSEIDIKRAKAAKERAEKQLSEKESDNKEEIKKALTRAEIRIELYQKYHIDT
ncbi:ATP synthase F1 subunit epsilon [Candidatus Marinamargulisbacteria bacterium SCGC AG-439-L15]|nr:ATP synthase F1 subunit epsilon [Candidatus Marinamargulisbacteria bacterium SCGC AG-439-L15]